MHTLNISLKHRFLHLYLRMKWEVVRILDGIPFARKDFAWKVRWRMAHDRRPLLVEIQDKYLVRNFAQKRGVKTAELLYVTDDPASIPFDTLPNNFFLKANHGCRWNILCKNGELFYYSDGEDLLGRQNAAVRKLSRDECIRYCMRWIKSVYSRNQWAYRHIPAKIIIEKFLEQQGGGPLVDYRCFTFNGVVKAVQITSPVYKSSNSNMFVDAHWNEIKLTVYRETVPNPPPQKPQNFGEIIAAAERLGQGLDFVRVDLYNTLDGVILAEMTVYPESGDENSPTACPEFNQWLGDQWVLPEMG